MKTPEEIKRGLEACRADECHGHHIIAILAYMFDCVHNEFKDFDSSTTAYAFILLFIDYLSLNNRYNNLKKKNSK